MFKEGTFKNILICPTQLSQNHRMVEFGRKLCWSSGPLPLLKQRQPKQVAQKHAQTAFEYLQEERTHNLSGQPVSVLSHLHSKELFPEVQREVSLFQFVLCCAPLKKSLVPSLYSPFRYLQTSPLLQTEQYQISQPLLTVEVLQSFHHLCGPMLDSFQQVQVSLGIGAPEPDTVIWVWSPPMLSRAEGEHLMTCQQYFAYFRELYQIQFFLHFI